MSAATAPSAPPALAEAHRRTSCRRIAHALDPNVLRGIVESAIESRIDAERWERAQSVEAAEHQSLFDFISQWPGAAS